MRLENIHVDRWRCDLSPDHGKPLSLCISSASFLLNTDSRSAEGNMDGRREAGGSDARSGRDREGGQRQGGGGVDEEKRRHRKEDKGMISRMEGEQGGRDGMMKERAG